MRNIRDFEIEQVYIDGQDQIKADAVPYRAEPLNLSHLNQFHHDAVQVEELRCAVSDCIPVLGITADQLLTQEESYSPARETDNLEGDSAQDLAKIVYLNRYANGRPQIAYCRGFGLKRGALASSIAHDSHNIIAISHSDADLACALNALIDKKGGIAICADGELSCLPLPIGGIMSDQSGEQVARQYHDLVERARQLGCTSKAPFVALSFLSLIVIPELKIGERGLFRFSQFNWVD